MFWMQAKLHVALNAVDYIDTPGTELTFTYFLQPEVIKKVSPSGGQLAGGTRVTIEGGGFRVRAKSNAAPTAST